MLFFDDEARNAEVESLGVTFILVGSDGVTHSLLEKGIQEWQRKRVDTKEQQV
jgi:magnesium-dependent phosphatase 1